MKAAAKQLEFERAAALRDEIQHDPAARARRGRRPTIVARAAEAAAREPEGRRPGRRASRPKRRGTVPGEAEVAERDGDHQRRGAAGGRGARRAAAGRRGGGRRDRHGLRLAAGDPRRARRADRLAGALARPADLGPDGHPEHPPPNGSAVGSPARGEPPGRPRDASTGSRPRGSARETIVPGGSAHSGSLIERVTLDDGSVVIAKHLDPRRDLDPPRARRRRAAGPPVGRRRLRADAGRRRPRPCSGSSPRATAGSSSWRTWARRCSPDDRPDQPGREPATARRRGRDP